jgi:hypothetical protein
VVAELKSVAGQRRLPLLLLLEPDRPDPRMHERTQNSGWRREGDVVTRDHRDDEFGALVQHVIVRYLVHGVQRQEIAQEIGYSQRQVQDWIGGRTARCYAQPVRRALQSLGIGMGRGGVSETSSRRGIEVMAACMGLLADVQWYMDDDWPRAREIKELSRLLAAGREPLG